MQESIDILQKEREKFLRIFNYQIETIPVTDSFHIYLVDARGEKTLRDVVFRVDKLITNSNVKSKDIITFPKVFTQTIASIDQKELQNITAVVSNDYKCNFIVGMRKEPSLYIPGFHHYLGWVGVIAAPVLRDHTIEDDFNFYFPNTRQFMEASVPKDELKFLDKVNTIVKEGNTVEQKREIEQLFGMAKLIRPELHTKYSVLYGETIKRFGVISTDIVDYLQSMKDENVISKEV